MRCSVLSTTRATSVVAILKVMTEERLFKPFEILLLLAGIFILVGIWLVSGIGDFSVWTVGKILYGVGVLLFLIKA